MAINSLSKRIKKKEQTTEPCFISTLHHDLLLQILLHLPNRRSMFQCLTVCKRWHSTLNNHKKYLESSSSRVLFSFSNLNSDEQTLHELIPEPSDPRAKPSFEPCILDFLPIWPDVAVRACCGDLLLVSCSLSQYYICNPHTRKWIQVPESPTLTPYESSFQGYALVFEPDKRSYKIVIVESVFWVHCWYKVDFRIFSSETGRWISFRKTMTFPVTIKYYTSNQLPNVELVTVGSTVFYLLECKGLKEMKLKGVIGFDLSSNETRFIKLPCKSKLFRRISSPTGDRLCLGVVRGRLRLSRIIKANKDCFGMKIWELDEDSDGDQSYGCWKLVHRVLLKKVIDTVFLMALHPADGDMVFLACDGEIFKFDIKENKYNKVRQSQGKEEVQNILKDSHMKVFPLVHSLWPTQICQKEIERS